MRFSRDLLVIASLFSVLIGVTVWGAWRRQELEQSQETYTPYSTHAASSSGTFALNRWLESLGYRTQRIEDDFRVPSEARVLFALARNSDFEEFEANAVLRWVEQGNTLIVAAQARFSSDQTNLLRGDSDRLLRALRARTQRLRLEVTNATLEQPLWGAASSLGVIVRTNSALVMERADYVQHLSSDGAPLLVSWTQGRGRVYLTSAPYLFTNDSLKNGQNVPLVRAMLSDAASGSLIAFDEYHLGFNNRASLLQVIYNSFWGWALIFVLVVVFAYLFVNGQRFGRTVPLPRELARRSPAEYVLSVAQLFRRAGRRSMILRHYHQQLKRTLGKPYRINANLPDDEFVRELSRFRQELDQEKLLQTLRQLEPHRVSERALVKTVEESIKLRERAKT